MVLNTEIVPLLLLLPSNKLLILLPSRCLSVQSLHGQPILLHQIRDLIQPLHTRFKIKLVSMVSIVSRLPALLADETCMIAFELCAHMCHLLLGMRDTGQFEGRENRVFKHGLK